jgi:hypothetical protein
MAEFKQHDGAATGLSVVPGFDLFRQPEAPELPLWRTTVLDFEVGLIFQLSSCPRFLF